MIIILSIDILYWVFDLLKILEILSKILNCLLDYIYALFVNIMKNKKWIYYVKYKMNYLSGLKEYLNNYYIVENDYNIKAERTSILKYNVYLDEKSLNVISYKLFETVPSLKWGKWEFIIYKTNIK